MSLSRGGGALFALAVVLAGCAPGGAPSREDAPAPAARDHLLRPPPDNFEQRCAQVAREVRIPVRCPSGLPGVGPWHFEHLNFGADRREWLMDLAGPAPGRGAFHLLIGARDGPWDLRTTAARWPRDMSRGDDLRLVGAEPLQPGGSSTPRLVRPRALKRTRVARHPALLLRVADYPAGGLHGGHLAVVWNQDGLGHLASVHVEAGTSSQHERAWLLATAESLASAKAR
jgi:hypothetical protein